MAANRGTPSEPASGGDILHELAAAVRFHRERADLTRLELARLAGVGKTVVFDIESGKRTVRVETLLRVLDALNIRLAWTSPLHAAFMESRGRDDAPRTSARPR